MDRGDCGFVKQFVTKLSGFNLSDQVTHRGKKKKEKKKQLPNKTEMSRDDPLFDL
jgi:hypothetical protein